MTDFALKMAEARQAHAQADAAALAAIPDALTWTLGGKPLAARVVERDTSRLTVLLLWPDGTTGTFSQSYVHDQHERGDVEW